MPLSRSRTKDNLQIDGRSYVMEIHDDPASRTEERVIYLSEPGDDRSKIAEDRLDQIRQRMGDPPLTKPVKGDVR